MSQLKNRLHALTLLDRAFASITDEELAAIVATLPADHVAALDELCGSREGGFTDVAARNIAVRATAARGRMSGELETISTLVCDPCLEKCIELLGDDAEDPTEVQLLKVTPKLIKQFGLPSTRLMIASSIAGEAPASEMLARLLKHDDKLALPPVEWAPAATLPTRSADEDVKAKRKAAKERKQADAKSRREQQLKAQHR